MPFIKVTAKYSNSPFYINVNAIRAVTTNDKTVLIDYGDSDESAVLVAESIEEVMQKIVIQEVERDV